MIAAPCLIHGLDVADEQELDLKPISTLRTATHGGVRMLPRPPPPPRGLKKKFFFSVWAIIVRWRLNIEHERLLKGPRLALDRILALIPLYKSTPIALIIPARL